MSESRKNTWSDLTIQEIENHIKWLLSRIPVLELEKRLNYKPSYGKARGSDVEISIIDITGIAHYLLFEAEQYASGDIRTKVRDWAERHFRRPNTTTIVISLVLQALRNRLVNEFIKDKKVADMISSPAFRIFPGSGDGKITEELKSFITFWVEQRL